MTIKGKRKAQARGGGRRRPAAAPRPVHPQATPWYRTSTGRVAVATVAATVIGLGGWGISNAASDSALRDERQSALEDYTDEVKSLSQTTGTAATQMALAPTVIAKGADVKMFGDATGTWIETFKEAKAQARELRPLSGMEGVNALYVESMALHESAAATFQLALETRDPMRAKILERAVRIQSHGRSVWETASELLDGIRRGAGMPAVGLPYPGAAAGVPRLPSPEGGAKGDGDKSKEKGEG